MVGKDPSTNIQAPEKLQDPNNDAYSGQLVWSLEFGVSLELGAWDLELRKGGEK